MSSNIYGISISDNTSSTSTTKIVFTDSTITTPATGDFITFDGATWSPVSGPRYNHQRINTIGHLMDIWEVPGGWDVVNILRYLKDTEEGIFPVKEIEFSYIAFPIILKFAPSVYCYER